ncbi:MAG: 50S ribosomal protein L24 [Candidatus Mesenet longicola]|uniref:Large ribosomal subunit protein uL24 n=1 Tax=Candidatus Mesenet longicola TaxID=1892558 RepID=A0A8J3HX14_9RICK|nr:MAG: 50S ribosomal protein L24 [Candidatus Mesenet longicola]GHM59161.1 MAG: 50S ribosomal protein L24 [Candidatus Mesenet longicola]
MGMKIVSGDDVIVISGDDKGKIGKIIKVIKDKGYKVVVSGVNLCKKHVKQRGNKKSGILMDELPIHISNVALFDLKNQVRTRVGFKLLDSNKVRFAKNSREVMD